MVRTHPSQPKQKGHQFGVLFVLLWGGEGAPIVIGAGGVQVGRRAVGPAGGSITGIDKQNAAVAQGQKGAFAVAPVLGAGGKIAYDVAGHGNLLSGRSPFL